MACVKLEVMAFLHCHKIPHLLSNVLTIESGLEGSSLEVSIAFIYEVPVVTYTLLVILCCHNHRTPSLPLVGALTSCSQLYITDHRLITLVCKYRCINYSWICTGMYIM